MHKLIMNIKEIKETQHGQGKEKTYAIRKIRLADDTSSRIWLTLWNSDSSLLEKLNLTKNDWISIRNFRTNEWKSTIGLTFVTNHTEIIKLSEDSVPEELKSNINNDWETSQNKKIIGYLDVIENIYVNKVIYY